MEKRPSPARDGRPTIGQYRRRTGAHDLDTLELAKNLRPAFGPDQAESLAAALAKSTEDSVATKTDIREVRTEIRELRAKMKEEFAAFRGDMALLRTDVVRWIVTAIAFNFVATAGLFMTFAKLFAK